MQELRRILVPTDFSEGSGSAFRFALLLAKAASGRVHLLHDVEIPTETITGATIIREQLDEAKRDSVHAMDKLVEEHAASEFVEERAIEKSTNPVRSIPLYASDNGIDLIVMGTHGRGGLKEKLIGSTAERVVREAPCPVITVPVKDGRRPPETIEHVVVPVDFSERSAPSLRYATGISSQFGARLTLLHAAAWDPEDVVNRQFDELIAAAIEPNVKVDTVRSENRAADAAVELARTSGAHLIVMATHGRTGVKRALTANVADEVVRHAPCPVMTIRSEVLDGKREDATHERSTR